MQNYNNEKLGLNSTQIDIIIYTHVWGHKIIEPKIWNKNIVVVFGFPKKQNLHLSDLFKLGL